LIRKGQELRDHNHGEGTRNGSLVLSDTASKNPAAINITPRGGYETPAKGAALADAVVCERRTKVQKLPGESTRVPKAPATCRGKRKAHGPTPRSALICPETEKKKRRAGADYMKRMSHPLNAGGKTYHE